MFERSCDTQLQQPRVSGHVDVELSAELCVENVVNHPSKATRQSDVASAVTGDGCAPAILSDVEKASTENISHLVLEGESIITKERLVGRQDAGLGERRERERGRGRHQDRRRRPSDEHADLKASRLRGFVRTGASAHAH
jgi:hypothetical protein